MLRAAMDEGGNSKEFGEIIRAMIKKARHFQAFRNKLAHGEFHFHLDEKGPQKVRTVMLDGKQNPKTAETFITMDDLSIAAKNFEQLATHIFDALEHAQGISDYEGSSLEKCLELIRALPNQANCQTPTPNPEIPK